MSGLSPAEGDTLIANLLLKGSDVNRGATLELGLFTNAPGTVDNTITHATLTEPTGGSYARKSLTNASWSVVGPTASYALQTFTATGSAYTGTVYGYFIATTGTAKKIIAIEVDPNGGYTMLQNDTYDITPNITFS